MRKVRRKIISKKRKFQEHEKLLKEIEALQSKVNYLQNQVNHISFSISKPASRATIGLEKIGIILYYLFLPFKWIKNIIRKIFRILRRLWGIIKNPKSYWLGLYWVSFAWLVILDGGIKEILHGLRHSRCFARQIGLLQ
ncbi:MAG: hypothetical protein JEZ03_10280 [Bacteroidales bacterium]|nr:hypothetical protein [Bacteroidales bacterium]